MALSSDLRIAARTLAKNKTWTAVALFALALGLGANVAIFSVVGLMIRVPLPYPDAAQLVHIPQTSQRRGFSESGVSLQDVRNWRAAPGIAAIAGYQSRPMAFSGEGEPQHLPAMQVTPEFFPILGVPMAVGRVFSPAEGPESDAAVAILSYGLWQGMFLGKNDVLGKSIRLNGRNYAIVGVMPQSFHFLYRKCDVWTPLSLPPSQRTAGWRSMRTLARLRPGVTVAQADTQVRAISERAAHEDPNNNRDWMGQVRPLSMQVIPKSARASAAAMFGAVTFVLLIACANVASLQLARGILRRKEFALRASLGARRADLVRLQVVESLLLSLAGGFAAVLTAYWAVPVLKRVAPSEMRIFDQATVDVSTLLFALGLSAVAGLLSGVAPAWILTRGHLAEGLQQAGRGSTGGRNRIIQGLVVVEMTLALVLVSGGTMMIRSLVRQQTANPGFETANSTAAQVLLSATRYPEPQQVSDFYARTLENLMRDPGVESAAAVQTFPLSGDNSSIAVRVEGQSDPRQDFETGNLIISPGYFQTMRIPLLAGREFSANDRAAAEGVAVVNEAFARRFWPLDPLPVGRRLQVGGTTRPWLTVVGVARNVSHVSISDPPRPEVYRPFRQAPERSMVLVARHRGGGANTPAAIRSSIAQVDREQPIFRMQSVETLLLERSPGARATTKVLAGLAVIALLLAAAGTYSVMAYTAAQRLREIGIRMALGATAGSVFRQVLRGGLALAGIGAVVGLPVAYGITPLLRMTTDGLQPNDPSVYAGVAVLLFAVAIAASAAPAVKAMRVDPASILRSE